MGGQKAAQVSAALGLGALKARQFEVLQRLATKHLTDKALIEIMTSEDFGVTSTERGTQRYEHSHLVTALDILLMYQCSRYAKGCCGCSMRRSYRDDPRTRFIELLKRWLRTNVVNASVSEEEVRRICALVRDVMNYPREFPSRNRRSFMHTLAEAYDHLRLQLREVLQRDRSCAELASRAIVLSRNLVSDAIAFLLLAPTDLKQTDSMPSLEVVSLWQSLPPEMNLLRSRADLDQQKTMKEAWATLCGSLIASLLTMRWAFRLFGGQGAEEEAVASGLPITDQQSCQALDDKSVAVDRDKSQASISSGGRSAGRSPKSSGKSQDATQSIAAMLAQIAHVKEEFKQGKFRSSGLAGAFREPEQEAARQTYLMAVEALADLVYLLGEVFIQFHRISDGLGDYGMIRVAPWLHPFLEALIDKVQHLKTHLAALNDAVDSELVVAKARGRTVKKPHPSDYMSARAHSAIDRAIQAQDCHATLLIKTFEELRSRSAPERLPHLVQGLSDACLQIQAVLTSPQFRARVGAAFPEPLSAGPVPSNLSALVDSAV
mmetsp:Transcript_13083/g.27190  ORF Transcript_13083/g.27190 Transcript_13083/m.27190 type:complete len:548 (-) Transcript_13083:54-1697(-)